MENARLKGKTYAIPFQRSTPVLYWNKDGLQGGGARSRERSRGLGRDGRLRQEAHEEGRVGQRHPLGARNPLRRQHFLAVLGAHRGKWRSPHGCRRQQDGFRRSRASSKPCIIFLDLSKTQGVQPPGLTSWGTAPKRLHGEEARHDLDRPPATSPTFNTTRPSRSASRCCRRTSRLWRPDRRRQFLHLQEHLAREAGDGLQIREVHDDARTRRRMVDRHRLCGDVAGRLRDRRR